MMELYKSPLPEGKSLCVYTNDELLFASAGKWLHPIFDLETFLQNNNYSSQTLAAHDTYIGKAAAFLLIRLGIKKIHANTASKLAVEYVEYLNKKGAAIVFSYDTLINRLFCKTEEELSQLFEASEINRIIESHKN